MHGAAAGGAVSAQSLCGARALRDQRPSRLRRCWRPDRRGDVPEGWQDALFALLSGAVLRPWVLVLPGRPPLGGHVLADRHARLARVEVGWVGERLAVAALDRPLLGERQALGGEDARRALMAAVLEADR